MESHRVEYKDRVDRDEKLERSVVSFLNYNGGGEIIIGIDSEGHLVGVADSSKEVRGITERLSKKIYPKILGLFEIVVQNIYGKDVIRIFVSSGMQKPYYIRRRGISEYGCFIRVGTSVKPMPEKSIEWYLHHKQGNSLTTPAISEKNLTYKQLHSYYNDSGLSLDEKFEKELGFYSDNGRGYNYLAYFLADINGTSFKITKYSDFVGYDAIEDEDYGDQCLITTIYLMLDKLEIENKTLVKNTPDGRVERRLINPVALREAFMNAIVHNEYRFAWPTVEFFPDRVTITSYGEFDDDVSEEDFFSGRFSMPRNRELVRILKDVGLVEGLGLGIPRILRAYDRSVISFSSATITVTFPYESSYVKSAISKKERSLSAVLNEADLEKVKPILDFLKKHGEITPQEARIATGKTAVTVKRYLSLLCESGILGSFGNGNDLRFYLKI